MQEPDKQVRQTTTQIGNTQETTQEIVEPKEQVRHKQNVVARIIWFIAGVIIALLALRFVLVLLGANEANSFASFIFSISHPFAAPFFSLFSYELEYGVSRLEISTLVAIAIYALVAYGLAKLATITQD